MASFPPDRPIVPTIPSMALSRAPLPLRVLTIRSTDVAMPSASFNPLVFDSSASLFHVGFTKLMSCCFAFARETKAGRRGPLTEEYLKQREEQNEAMG